MKPIKISIHGSTKRSPQEVCTEFLDTERWSDFKGYFILPGIKSASFESKTPSIVGSRIKVQNMDGSSHMEEIIEWNVENKMALKFQEFNSPLKNFASHFIETWDLVPTTNGTEITRSIAMYPKGVVGWLMLLPISQLMKKAFEKNADQIGSD